MIRRMFTLGAALAGLALTTQAPEFAQQYRQRLGGAIDELAAVARDFDRDAGASALSRDEALGRLQRSGDPFVRDRGTSIEGTIGRLARLEAQERAFDAAAPIARPIVVLRDPDPGIATAAWEIFEPAVPLTGPAALWGLLGALLGWGPAAVVAALAGRRRRKVRLSA